MTNKKKVQACVQCGEQDSVWGYKTSAMKRKVLLCWDHLQNAEKKSNERGNPNLINPTN
jgi:hypothetical protein